MSADRTPDAPAAAIEAVRGLGTPALSDALDRLGVPARGLQGFRSWGAPAGTIAGPAYTIAYRERTSGGTVGDYIDDVPEGSIVVLSNAGRVDCTVWGDLLTRRAHRMRLAGTVIDGAFRDVDVVERLGYPVYARAPFMVTGKGRVELEATQVPLTVGGVTVEPGDVVCADRSGVLAIPRAAVAEVAAAAAEIAGAEERIAALVADGERLDEARSRLGYHALQQPPAGA